MSSIELALSRSSVIDRFKGYVILTKPRINALLLFTAYSAAIVAAGGFPSLKTTFVLLIGLALSGGGAAAFNMWYDKDIDQVMSRTQNRPIQQGLMTANQALAFALLLGAASFFVFYFGANLLSAVLSVAGYVYYAIVYTVLLKRRTPQNIVIGGGAGAIPPLIGWAAVTGDLSLAAWAMFLIIFFWTPAHFWSLALYKNKDYKRANVPMMPVVRGARTTKIQSFIYTLILLITIIGLAIVHQFGLFYFIASSLAGLSFLAVTARLIQEPDDEFTWAKRTFVASLIVLPLLFSLMVGATLWHVFF
ncbi:heme o synthase [Pullulanibacillus sp. KACC 23026]|uniref:heme o synthase n=1 Tax=Pullulanibacillus sp. KACC 23026 TaxID=3028315 RepID=UPI0023B12D1D|nr:heme o synthase [Pullulanibacillus sp. KACC 23026]WEG12071.1 heme o synthase [Pullulanibacillus sp. KACC 23026]